MDGKTRREYIADHWGDCLTFARDVLHLKVDAKGRAKSLQGQGHSGNEALIIDKDVWYDHKMHVGGDIIWLCAWGMFRGDKGQAMQYLCGDFYDVRSSEWRNAVDKLARDCEHWHENLLYEDRVYLHERRITDETIARLHLGSMTKFEHKGQVYKTHRLVIPYFQNGRIVYCITRDRTGKVGAKKYIKYTLPKEEDGKTDREVLQNIPWGLQTLSRRDDNYQWFGHGGVISKRDWLIICEGAFDAFSFEQEMYCVLATMGGAFSPSVEREVIGFAKTFPNVLIIFDNDGAGTKFQRSMAEKLFSHRVNFFTASVPKSYNGKPVKDVSDYYTAGGDPADFILSAKPGIEMLAGLYSTQDEVKKFFRTYARYADKSEAVSLYEMLKARRSDEVMPGAYDYEANEISDSDIEASIGAGDEESAQTLPESSETVPEETEPSTDAEVEKPSKRFALFNPFWLKSVLEEAVKAPAETVIMSEMEKAHNLRYVEGSGFFEYVHGVWKNIPDNKVKSYADELLGHFSSNARMTASMKFAQARLSTVEMMNTLPVINLQNGILLPEENCRFVPHSPAYLSTIQLGYRYDPFATCPKWLSFLQDISETDPAVKYLLQDIGGYGFWPNNSLEKCFFLIGDGGNGKGVFMDTLREVFGRDNCSALPLSSLGGKFDPIMLQYSLVNFASETRVDLRGNIESLRAITSGDDIIAAHKGIDAVKFSPRCKLITSCNDFFNTGDITHALMRRMIFVKFPKNILQMKKVNVYLREELKEELPGILNWCIEGYLRLLSRAKNHEQEIFTVTQSDKDLKREFMRTTNSVAYFIEEKLSDVWDVSKDVHDIYKQFKVWAEDNGYKSMSIGAFQRNIKKTLSEMRPEVKKEDRGAHTWLVFPDRGEFSENV